MHFSSLPLLIVIVFGFMTFLVFRLRRLGRIGNAECNGLVFLVGALLSWGGVSGFLASEGAYVTERFLALAPGYWLPFVPVMIAGAIVMMVRAVRNGLRTLVDDTPRHWLTGIHMIRMLAVGSLIKAANGLFPEKFAWYVGVPDLLFGVSAVLITWWSRKGRLSDGGLIVWNLLGAMVILVPVNGLMHLYMKEPLFKALFVYPMALAPTLVVPTLVMLNLLMVWRLVERKRKMACRDKQ